MKRTWGEMKRESRIDGTDSNGVWPVQAWVGWKSATNLTSKALPEGGWNPVAHRKEAVCSGPNEPFEYVN